MRQSGKGATRIRQRRTAPPQGRRGKRRDMGLGFSLKLAPGVRVRASSRGIRTSVGPRAARVHVGGGRSGFSTGVGPVGYYTSVSGSSRQRQRSTTGSVNRQLAATARQQAAQEKAA